MSSRCSGCKKNFGSSDWGVVTSEGEFVHALCPESNNTDRKSSKGNNDSKGSKGSKGHKGKKDAANQKVEALQNLLDCERESKRLAEQKLSEALREVSFTFKMKEQLKLRLLQIRGAPSEMAKLQSVQECEQLEKVLRKALESVEKRKAAIIEVEIGDLRDKQFCVVCRENEKSVVLLPCLHLCLCVICSDQIEQCPLCRRPIHELMGVYS